MYPTAQNFKRWAASASIAELGDVIHICIAEIQERVGPSELVPTLEAAGIPLHAEEDE